MIESAMKARDNGISPYSNRLVGTSILSETGSIYTGAVLEGDITNNNSICSESAAIIQCITQGDLNIKLAIIVNNSINDFPYPCGKCRQLLSQYGDYPLMLIRGDGSQRLYKLSELFPHSNTLKVQPNAYKSALDEILGHIETDIDKEGKIKRIEKWTVSEVGDWLRLIEYSDYVNVNTELRNRYFQIFK